MTDAFSRPTVGERTIFIGNDFPPIVALCAEGELLKRYFKSETDAGRIVIVLSASESQTQLNTNKLALADELFVVNPNGQYDDFQAAMFLAAKSLGKHIRVLKD